MRSRNRRLSYEMKIAVVGTGAIGSFYGGKLAHGGRERSFPVKKWIREN